MREGKRERRGNEREGGREGGEVKNGREEGEGREGGWHERT